MPTPLPVQPVGEIDASPRVGWLIEEIWSEEGVGWLVGTPKSFKTWLALHLALCVATGKPALERFSIPTRGRVLLFAAEDAPVAVRARLEGMAKHQGLTLAGADVHLIRSPSLRLDRQEDRERLLATIRQHRPRLLVLDPFVRVQNVNENSAQEISEVLAHLRDLQRRFSTAIMVVHHARKNGAGDRAGLALRGSSDLWAWADSTLYLRRREEKVRVAIEHRSAPARDPFELELVDGETEPYLRLSADEPAVAPAAEPDLRERVVLSLRSATGPCRQETLRQTLRVKTQRLVQVMRELLDEGVITRTSEGWLLAAEPRDDRGGGANVATPLFPGHETAGG